MEETIRPDPLRVANFRLSNSLGGNGMSKARDFNSNVRRCRTIRRLVVILDVLASSKHPKNSVQMTVEVNDRLKETYSRRTIHRDLAAAEESGAARFVKGGWIGRNHYAENK